ncbi:MAG: sigma-70 family RNA polymerase sigma factor [Ginsengibacter sp.]
MTNQYDLIIIQKVLAGDVQAYATLVNHYKDMALSLAYNILLNREEAEEAAQDAFVKAYTSLRSFKGNARFSTWVYRIIVNTALNKKKTRKYFSVELHESLDEELPLELNNVVITNTNAEHKKYIQLAMRSLNDNERICIALYYLNELSVEEINELTGISTSNIKVLLHRARKNLYKALHHYLKDEITNLI